MCVCVCCGCAKHVCSMVLPNSVSLPFRKLRFYVVQHRYNTPSLPFSAHSVQYRFIFAIFVWLRLHNNIFCYMYSPIAAESNNIWPLFYFTLIERTDICISIEYVLVYENIGNIYRTFAFLWPKMPKEGKISSYECRWFTIYLYICTIYGLLAQPLVE